MQYKTTESALNALKKITNLRCYKVVGEERTPAEVWLVKHLVQLWAHREKVGKRKKAEKEFRHLKSISRGLGLWDKDYIKVLVRLGSLPSEEVQLRDIRTSVASHVGVPPGKLFGTDVV